MSTTTTGQSRVPRSLRFQILRRDNHACRYCGATAPKAKLTVDHVVAQALGGTNAPGNLVTACQPCNSGKGATPADAAIVADVSADALRWARARSEAAEQLKEDDEDLLRHTMAVLDYCADWFLNLLKLDGKEIGWGPEDSDPHFSIRMWLERGLAPGDIASLVEHEVVPRADWLVERHIPLWTYLASRCWKRIREIDELAQQIVSSELAR